MCSYYWTGYDVRVDRTLRGAVGYFYNKEANSGGSCHVGQLVSVLKYPFIDFILNQLSTTTIKSFLKI